MGFMDVAQLNSIGCRAASTSVAAQQQIALFRSLFRGRDDVYPRRFEVEKQVRPASTACGNEWVRGIAKSPGSNAAIGRLSDFLP